MLCLLLIQDEADENHLREFRGSILKFSEEAAYLNSDLTLTTNYFDRLVGLDRSADLRRTKIHRSGAVAVEPDPADRQLAVLLFLVVNAPAKIDFGRPFDRERQQDSHFVGDFMLDRCAEW